MTEESDVKWERWQKKRTFVREVAGKYAEVYKSLLEQPRVFKSKQKPFKGGPAKFGKNLVNPQATATTQAIETHIDVLAPGRYGQKHGHMNSAVFFILEGRGHDITATGAVRIHFPSSHGLRPYVAGGAGAIVYSGKAPSATLTGQYGFLFANMFPFNERDVTTVSVRSRDRVPVGLAGGGVEYDFSKRHGLRADARLEFHPSRVHDLVPLDIEVAISSNIMETRADEQYQREVKVDVTTPQKFDFMVDL